jgi:hypothetical protein
MRTQLEQRLAQLKGEYENGQKMLADLEGRQAELRATLLRISGAAQVLEECLGAAEPPSGSSDGNGANGAQPAAGVMPTAMKPEPV